MVQRRSYGIKVILSLLFLSVYLSSCSQNISAKRDISKKLDTISKKGSRSAVDKLKSNLKKEFSLGKEVIDHFLIMTEKDNFEEVKGEILSNGGTINFSDKGISFIDFSNNSLSTYKLIESDKIKSFAIDGKFNLHREETSKENESTPTAMNPIDVMQASKLIKMFKEEKGIDLNGENATIAVFDTGLDIARTDVFQDRIIALRSLREVDNAFVTEAETKEIRGVSYLAATVKGEKILIEKTSRLAEDRKYYLGFFSEGQYKGSRYTGKNGFDFNQDGKDDGVFPVVVFKGQDGVFQAYINVNDVSTYGKLGDRSIEDEKLLFNFNMGNREERSRYVGDSENEINSYYTNTTRMDIKKGESLVDDRTKGFVNVGITLEADYELTEDGKDLKKLSKDSETPLDEKIYKVGLVGFDIGGHGTYCAAIAASNYQTAPKFSSPAFKAKIIGVSFLGESVSQSDFIQTVLKLIKTYPNVVFNFSFGYTSEFNDTNSFQAIVLDDIAKFYNTAFVKAAGNEGSGINTHGMYTSKNIISVASFYSSSDRNTHSDVSIEDGKYFVTPSSSRGPMIDGFLKPDIGAPGWVMSATPFAETIARDQKKSFSYISGTSMAAPNAVSIIALLYDGVIKAGLASTEDLARPLAASVGIDKIHKALKNSALAYDKFHYVDCHMENVFGGRTCVEEEKEYNFRWYEGGAGRINAYGAWNILEDIIDETNLFYVTETRSGIDRVNRRVAGHFSYDYIPERIYFTVAFDKDKSMPGLVAHQEIVLKISDETDWLSFDVASEKKERTIDVFGAKAEDIFVYVRKEKLMEHGVLKSGVHSALIKGYRIDSPEAFDFVFPITLVGMDSHFDSNVDNFKFATKGHLPNGHSISYFVPVKTNQTSLIVDLVLPGTLPGSMLMKVFRNGVEIDKKRMGATTLYATNISRYFGEGRNSLRYVISGKQQGIYEIALTSSEYMGANIGESYLGSHFTLDVSQYSLEVDNITMKNNPKISEITLDGVRNNGSPLRISSALVYSDSIKKEKTVRVKHTEKVKIPLSIYSGVKSIKISTEYICCTEKTDIDIFLEDKDGRTVAKSAGSNSFENIEIKPKGDGPSDYNLIVHGFSVPNEAKEDDFTLKIVQQFKDKVVLTNEFTEKFNGKKLTAKKYIGTRKRYYFTTHYDNDLLDNYFDLPEGYAFNIDVDIRAFTRNDGVSDISVLRNQLSL